MVNTPCLVFCRYVPILRAGVTITFWNRDAGTSRLRHRVLNPARLAPKCRGRDFSSPALRTLIPLEAGLTASRSFRICAAKNVKTFTFLACPSSLPFAIPILITRFLCWRLLGMWAGRDLNSHALRHRVLNPARLPIPPPAR